MKVLVTGATGFIGGRLARQLRASGVEVRALVRDRDRAAPLATIGIELCAGDITDRASVRAAMAGVEGVYHVAGWYRLGARDRSAGERINVAGTRHVLEAMRDLGVPRGVYTSTLAVFSDTRGRLVDESHFRGGPWISAYDRSKWRAHYEVAEPMMALGLPLVVVLPGVVYGPGDTSPVRELWVRYLTRRLPLVPRRTAYCWAHVDDVAHAHALAMEKGRPGESYIIAGPRHSLIEALAIAERITGIPAPRLHPGPAAMRLLAALMGAVGSLVPLPETYAAESLRASAGVTYLGDNAKARRELGYDPRPLEAGLRETLEHEQRLLGRTA